MFTATVNRTPTFHNGKIYAGSDHAGFELKSKLIQVARDLGHEVVDLGPDSAERVDYPLFVQGERPRSLLLEGFRRSGDGVLLGSASFWEGVDVIGEALSLVVIDKLPFAAPDDPVIEARSAALRRNGGNPFTGLFLPQAVIALKQGAGRLIRDVHDRGVLVICDPRITTRSYGAVFLESLPPMKQASSREEAEDFLKPGKPGSE